jgi:hypothetical protein
MKTRYIRTRCTVKLLRSANRKGEYYLTIEIYPIYGDASNTPQRQVISLNRIITTPVWDKSRPTRGNNFLPKRNSEGIIQCRSEADQEACIVAHKYCQLQQAEYDNKALYPDQYRQKKEADRKAERDFIQYIAQLMERRRPTVSETTTNLWSYMLKTVKQFTTDQPVCFGDLTPTWCNRYRDFLMTSQLSPNSQKLYFTIFKIALHTAYKSTGTFTIHATGNNRTIKKTLTYTGGNIEYYIEL